MRKVFSVALMMAMLVLVGVSRDAGATVTFDLIWADTTGGGVGVGTDTITALPGDTLRLHIVMENDQVIQGHFISILFDPALSDELNLLSSANWSGSSYGMGTSASTYVPLGNTVNAAESPAAFGGRVHFVNSGWSSGPLQLPLGTRTVGTVEFVVTASVATDGFDVFSGLFNTGDSMNSVPTVFNSAAVNVIPEPGTVSLLGLGLVGLVLAGRRSRRS
jgi:hypothetical protein